MSNLEHLIENGLCRLDEGKSYKEWREIMQQDCNWKGNENITLDNLWEICQYVIFTWDSDKEEIVRCKDCEHATMTSDGKMCKYCEMDTDDFGNQRDVYHDADWFCADGEKWK